MKCGAVVVCRPMKNTISGNEGRSFMKILVAADSDLVVGVHLVGPDCSEIIQVSPRIFLHPSFNPHCYRSLSSMHAASVDLSRQQPL